MKILVWNAPWAVQGDLHFFRNCYLKHLLLQANLLAKQKVNVDLVINDYIDDPAAEKDSSINTIKLSANDIFSLTQRVSSPLIRLYKNDDIHFVSKIKTLLTPLLASHYDAILLWENPVPFLEEMYPDALIVHQMPGAFSRAPFPATVTFDVEGLYRDGALHKFSRDIIKADSLGNSLVLDGYKSNIQEMYQKLPPIFKKEINREGFDTLALLPLQVSSHYAFQADTPYASQMDYLLDVLANTPKKTGLITTQYVSPKIADTILTPESYKSLKPHWENLIYSSEFDKVANISQHILPQADIVITSSSSVGIQAMLWSKKVEIYGETFLSNYSDAHLELSGANVHQAQKNLLGFILTKHQVLTTKVVHDGGFLVNLLEQLIHNKKQHKLSTEKFVNFNNIDPNYESELVSSINFSRVTKAIRSTSPMLDAEIITIEKFERSIRNNKIETISFDVFDTLIARPVEVPADAYQFLEVEALKISNGGTEDFARVRLTAEVETRNSSTEGEITLDQIYAHIKNHYQLTDETLEKIKQKEIELEISLVQRRSIGYKLWNIAKASRKPITVISDMYLPGDVVLKMLDKTGYSDYKKLYVSSNYGVRKKEGPLFDIVIKDQDLNASTHLHIGDNKLADGEMAQARGMHAFRIPRAIDRMRSNPHFAKIFNPRLGVGEKSRSVIAGLIANKLFDMPSGDLEQNTLFMGSPHRLGYAAIGPLLSAYMLWLTRRAKTEGVSRLYFLSREGWILKEIYDQLNKENPSAVPSTYLYCSRRAARVAAIRNISDITAVASQPFEAGVRLERLLNQRFGLEVSSEVEARIANSVFESSEALLASDSQGRVAFSQLCVTLSEFILSRSEVEREVYLQYLNESGLTSESNPAVVDIGWKANMQGSLGALIDRPLKGYYYATLQGVERWEIRGHSVSGFAGDSLTIGHEGSIINNRHLCEFLTCKADGSLIHFSRSNSGVLSPQLRQDEGQSIRNNLIDEIHMGAINFAADLQYRFGSMIENLIIDPQLAERVFKQFVESPTAPDAQLLAGQFFEDAFGGVDKKFVIANDRKGISVWTRGAQALYPEAAPVAPPAKVAKATVPDKLAVPKAVPIAIKQPEVGEARKTRVRGFFGYFILLIEKMIIRSIVSQKKFEKYKRDRNSFFEDSSDRLATNWFAFTNPEI
jgi:predicted HAD superfamily hydrolase